MYDIIDTYRDKKVAYWVTREEGEMFIRARKKRIPWIDRRAKCQSDYTDEFTRFKLVELGG